MSWMLPSVTATLIGTLALAVLYWVLYRQYGERHLKVWAVSWSIYTIRFVFELVLQLESSSALVVGHQLSNLFSGLALLWGMYLFLGKKLPQWVLGLAIVQVAWVFAGTYYAFSWTLLNLPIFTTMALINIWIGCVLLRSSQLSGLGKQFTGWAFILWGVHKFNYPFLRGVAWFAPWGFFIATLLEFMVASGTLLVYFEKTRRSLSESEARFRLLAENAKDLIFRYRLLPDRGFEYVSPSTVVLTGYAPEEYYTNPDILFEILHPDDRCMLNVDCVKKMSNNQAVAIRWKHKDGHYIWLEHRVGLAYGEDDLIAIEAIGRDITDRKMAEEVLSRYELLSLYARDIILFLRSDGRIIEANEAAVKAYGYKREELLTLNATDLRALQARGSLFEQLKESEEKAILIETIHQRKNGTVFPVEVSLQSVNFAENRTFFAIVRDITERKQAEETINHLAYHDPLTDLPNRILFFDRLNVALTHAHRHHKLLAVMFLDLDRFKIVNDMMGHAVGDILLKEVAKKLFDCIRQNDTVARIGGDEFTILLPEISKEQDAGKVAQKILDLLKKPWRSYGYEVQISASIGIAVYPNDGEDAGTLTRNADTAMYRAKEQGDNYQFFTSAMNTRAVERLELEISLRKALENRDFELFYQPQVNIQQGCLVGVEALLRWNRPSYGIVLPIDFISIAEDTGLIVLIGEWVLSEACRQSVAWRQLGLPPVRMAVNISANQFRQQDFIETVARILETTGMNPELLELEITESTVMQDAEFTIVTLQRLREMGIRIAIDDFGTGYSSLNYLRKFPITTLKVDRSFVSDVLTNVEDAAIVATIIVLAQNLKLDIVIEGVETDEQLSFFEQQECFEMQGYLFSKPVPAVELQKILEKAAATEKKVSHA